MKKVATVLLAFSFIVAPVSVFAAAPTGGTGGGAMSGGSANVDEKIHNPINTDTFSAFVGQLISTIITVLFPFLVLAFIYVGFLFVQAQGNTTKLEEARSALTWTVVGAFIMMAAWGFSKVLEATVRGFE